MKKVSEIFGIDHVEIDYPDIKLLDSEIEKQQALRRNATIVTCPNCGVKGNEPNMLRWHFDNCKTKLKNCLQCGNLIPRQGVKDFLYEKKFYCNRSCYMESKKGKPPIIMTEEIKKKLSELKKGKPSNNQYTKGRKLNV
jgi:hypothetical protein